MSKIKEKRKIRIQLIKTIYCSQKRSEEKKVAGMEVQSPHAVLVGEEWWVATGTSQVEREDGSERKQNFKPNVQAKANIFLEVGRCVASPPSHAIVRSLSAPTC